MKKIVFSIIMSLANLVVGLGGTRRYIYPASPSFRPAKFLPLRLDKIASAYARRGKVENAFRINAEISFAKGNLYLPLNWKSRVLLAGIQSAYLRNLGRAANWLSSGYSLQKSAIFARSVSYGFPPAFVAWLAENKDALDTPEGWRAAFASHTSKEDFERLLVYITMLGVAIGLLREMYPLLTRLTSSQQQDLRKAIYLRSAIKLKGQKRLYSHAEVFEGGDDNIAGKITHNLVTRVFLPAKIEGAFLRREEFDWLAANSSHYPVEDLDFQTACRAIQLIAGGRYVAAQEELAERVNADAELMRKLDDRKGPLKVFVGGFGWTGSSAIFDAFRGYAEVKEMPGVGDVPHINEGADSEPMIHQGPSGLMDLSSECIGKGKLSTDTWKKFLQLYVLADNYKSYFEYKTICANRKLRTMLGSTVYYAIINQLLYDYASAMNMAIPASYSLETGKSDKVLYEERAKVFTIFGQRLVNALFPSDEDIVLFNNSINTNNVRAMKYAGARSIYISVNRTILDQMADQRQSNIFFRAGALGFAYTKYGKIGKFRRGRTEIQAKTDVTFHEVNFEDWVTDESVRRLLTEQVVGYYEPIKERQYFRAEESEKNVNIFNRLLTPIEIRILTLARRFFPGL